MRPDHRDRIRADGRRVLLDAAGPSVVQWLDGYVGAFPRRPIRLPVRYPIPYGKRVSMCGPNGHARNRVVPVARGG